MGNSNNSDDEGAEGSPPLLRGHLVLVYLQTRLAVEDTAVRDAARSTTRTTSMYNAGIEKVIPATLPHTPSCKVRNEGIVLPIHGPLRRRPHHWLPTALPYAFMQQKSTMESQS